MTATGHDIHDLGGALRCSRCRQTVTTDDPGFGWFAMLSDQRKAEILRWVSSWCPADGLRPTRIAEERRDCRP